MDPIEKNNISLQDELQHWWIKTRLLYIDKVIGLIKKDEINILEYGCGTGQNIYYLNLKKKKINEINYVYGIDPNIEDNFQPEWVSNKINFIKNDKELNNKFDLIITMDVLEHLEDDYFYLKEWIKKLNKGGIILITDVHPSLPFLAHFRKLGRKSTIFKRL